MLSDKGGQLHIVYCIDDIISGYWKIFQILININVKNAVTVYIPIRQPGHLFVFFIWTV